MEPADSFDEFTASIAPQFSRFPERTRHALKQAEECKFWRFRHHGVMKTEDALAAEIGSIPGAEHSQWLVRPSWEDARASEWIRPVEMLWLFDDADPSEVRQSRLLLLEFVPYSDLPAYTLGELADELESFVADQKSDALHLTETGTMVAKPGGEGWARRVLGPLYPDSADLPPVCPRLREEVLHWRAGFIQELVSGVRSAAKRGDRASKRAALALWTASRSRLCEFLGNVENQDILRRETESLMRGTGSEATADLGSVTALALLAAHCSAEIAFGTQRRTRSALGGMVELDNLHRPRLRPGVLGSSKGYDTLLSRDSGSWGARVQNLISLRSRLTAEEVPVLKRSINDYVADIRKEVGAADLSGIHDDVLREAAKERLQQRIHRIRSGFRAQVAGLLGLPLPECPRPLQIPNDLKLRWEDVTLRLLDDSTLVIFIRKGQTEVCRTRHFSQMTFTDRRSHDEERPGTLWLMLAGIIKHATSGIANESECSKGQAQAPHCGEEPTRGGGVAGFPAGRTFRLGQGDGAEADKARVTERKQVQELSDKLRSLIGIGDDVPGPFRGLRNIQHPHTYEIIFRVDTAPKREMRALWSPGHEVSSRKRQ